MTDRPIIFSGPMIRALLDGRKTQTRRVLKWARPAPYAEPFQRPDGTWWLSFEDWGANAEEPLDLPYQIGDRLWVRETWASHPMAGKKIIPRFSIHHPWGSPIYKATFGALLAPVCEGFSSWRPSIHMPRWASRITLTVTDVRVQRVQEISEEDARAEGVDFEPGGNEELGVGYGIGFCRLWSSLNAKRGHGWDANPWVGAYTFTVQQENIDALPNAAE